MPLPVKNIHRLLNLELLIMRPKTKKKPTLSRTRRTPPSSRSNSRPTKSKGQVDSSSKISSTPKQERKTFKRLKKMKDKVSPTSTSSSSTLNKKIKALSEEELEAKRNPVQKRKPKLPSKRLRKPLTKYGRTKYR